MHVSHFKSQIVEGTLCRRACTLLLMATLVSSQWQHPARADDAKDALIVEALVKLKRFDLSAVKLETRQAVVRHVDAQRGTVRFVELVEMFNLRDQTDELVALAIDKPAEPAAAAAGAAIVRLGEIDRLARLVDGPEPRAASAAVHVLGSAQNRRAVELLTALAEDDERSPALRSDAIRALGRSPAGEKAIVALAAEDRIATELKPVAASVLMVSRNQQLRAEAAKYLPIPTGAGDNLPPLRELARRTGDPRKGAAVYVKATCITCHTAGPDVPGVEFGPSLSEIGSKLSHEALYEAIIAPDAGISFGYEGVLVTLASGQQLLGYIASETSEQVVLRQIGGVSTPIAKSDIASRQPQTQSLMPPNLHRIITEQELVDLIEYLATLKKPQ